MSQFTKKRAITLPLFKLSANQEYYFKVLAPIYTGKEIAGSQMAAPKLANVLDLETGELGQIIVGAVLFSSLTEAYEGEDYVGRCFEIVKIPADGNRRYALWNISEVEEPENARDVEVSEATQEPAMEVREGGRRSKRAAA